ncbi:MAG: M23 family metallopeptidase [Culturomica sp.]|jgi:septal ring factor EnvC (AmiA/AmiB activator)|nr:M23 family metallopeptidase [Culturomica sp.]
MRAFLVHTCFLCVLFYPVASSAQAIDGIRKEKEKSEKEIAYLDKLLNETRSSRSLSFDRLNIVQKKVTRTKQLIGSLEKEVEYYEGQIRINERKIDELGENRKEILELYSKLVYGLWKKKDKADKMMFIFAATDFNQAYNRYKYFEQIQSYSKRQFEQIRVINDSLESRNNQLKQYIVQKNETLKDIDVQNRSLLEQREGENRLIREFRKKEKELTKKLVAEQKNRARLAKELDRLIAEEIRKAAKTGKQTEIKLTPEQQLVSDEFVKNRGKLPWPVEQGIITEKFGIYTNPLYPNVKQENAGVTIATLKNSEIRAVFNGVVASVVFYPGYNNIVMISHGNYYTAYTNLIEVKVKAQQAVNTKQVIGKVGHDMEKGSIFTFTVNKEREKLDPEQWLAK